MRKLNLTRAIGLEGFCNSGKSSSMKKLCKFLMGVKGARLLHVFRYNGIEIEAKSVDMTADVIVVLEIYGKVVVVVSGGDYTTTPRIILNILIHISIRVDVLFMAMRYRNPAVGDEYRTLFDAYGIKVESVFKPGLKRIHELPEGVLDKTDEIWMKVLLEKAGECLSCIELS